MKTAIIGLVVLVCWCSSTEARFVRSSKYNHFRSGLRHRPERDTSQINRENTGDGGIWDTIADLHYVQAGKQYQTRQLIWHSADRSKRKVAPPGDWWRDVELVVNGLRAKRAQEIRGRRFFAS